MTAKGRKIIRMADVMVTSVEESELSTNMTRWAGLAAMLGSAAFVVSAVPIAPMPRGCIGDECAARPMRETAAAGAC